MDLDQKSAEVVRACMTEQSMVELLAVAGRTNRTTFRDQVLRPLLDAGLVEMTLPEKPTSGKQRYRATARGVHGWMRGRGGENLR
ncbi:Fic family protein [Methanofollis sp. UBA420]|jgi:ATP-dependent DNA helicase RecG|uniref:Fic family protein n=1 Tax=Methanofollis sp. UBA420 TaxID=1915514 RepID=UPI00316ADC00